MSLQSRKVLTVGTVLAVVATMLGVAQARQEPAFEQRETVFGNGLVSFRDSLGGPGEPRLSVTFSADLESGIGKGAISDALHPEYNFHFDIKRVRKVGNQVTLQGIVVDAAHQGMIGENITVVGQSNGAIASLIIVVRGDQFVGAGSIVTGIIAILIGL